MHLANLDSAVGTELELARLTAEAAAKRSLRKVLFAHPIFFLVPLKSAVRDGVPVLAQFFRGKT